MQTEYFGQTITATVIPSVDETVELRLEIDGEEVEINREWIESMLTEFGKNVVEERWHTT